MPFMHKETYSLNKVVGMLRKITFVFILFGLFLSFSQVRASEHLVTIDWELIGGTDLNNQPVTYSKPVLTLNVELGSIFLMHSRHSVTQTI